MVLIVAIFIYVAAMVTANLLVLWFGPVITPFNAFFLIGLDLSLRDYLHVRLRASQMMMLISISGLVAWFLNPAAGQIAIASAVSFTAAGTVDWMVFAKSKGRWLSRANKSNTAGAAVDSILFPTLAFGVFMPWVVLGQFMAKAAGGFVWALLIQRFLQKRQSDIRACKNCGRSEDNECVLSDSSAVRCLYLPQKDYWIPTEAVRALGVN